MIRLRSIVHLLQASSDNNWWSRHPSVLIAVGITIGCGPAVLVLWRSWRSWRVEDTLLSLRLESVRDGMFAVGWIAIVITALVVPEDSDVKGSLLIAVLLGPVVAGGVTHLLVQRQRRSERRATEAELQKHNLPLRRRVLSWKIVAVLCYFLGPFVILFVALVLAIPVELFMGEASQDVGMLAVVGTAVAVWAIGSLAVTLRQLAREYHANRAYWREYRAALHSPAHDAADTVNEGGTNNAVTDKRSGGVVVSEQGSCWVHGIFRSCCARRLSGFAPRAPMRCWTWCAGWRPGSRSSSGCRTGRRATVRWRRPRIRR